MPTSSPEEGEGARWSWDEEKAFENAIATVAGGGGGDGSKIDSSYWDEIAARVSTKAAAEVRRHFEVLVDDVEAIEAGKVPVPRYLGEEVKEKEKEQSNGGQQSQQYQSHGGFGERRGVEGKTCSKAEQERRKGIPWTEEEHR